MSVPESYVRSVLEARTNWIQNSRVATSKYWAEADCDQNRLVVRVLTKEDWIRDVKPSRDSNSALSVVYEGIADQSSRVVPGSASAVKLKDTFTKLADAWDSETFVMSSLEQQVLNVSYQRIIGLGPTAVPLVIDRLANAGGNWFWALRAMTGEDPIPRSDYGDFDKMRQHWINWAIQKGIVDDRFASFGRC